LLPGNLSNLDNVKARNGRLTATLPKIWHGYLSLDPDKDNHASYAVMFRSGWPARWSAPAFEIVCPFSSKPGIRKLSNGYNRDSPKFNGIPEESHSPDMLAVVKETVPTLKPLLRGRSAACLVSGNAADISLSSCSHYSHSRLFIAAALVSLNATSRAGRVQNEIF